jgi:hypothetical protein
VSRVHIYIFFKFVHEKYIASRFCQTALLQVLRSIEITLCITVGTISIQGYGAGNNTFSPPPPPTRITAIGVSQCHYS